MKENIIITVERDEVLGVTKYTNKSQEVSVTITDRFDFFANDLPAKPKRMIYKGKLTDKAKDYIDLKPFELEIFARLIRPTNA